MKNKNYEYNIGDIVVLKAQQKQVYAIVGREQLFSSNLYHLILCGDEKHKILFTYETEIKEKL
jgi:hypothetical protein